MSSVFFRLAGTLVFMTTFSLSAASLNPPTTPQTAPMTSAEKKNLQFVLNWWREVLQARHVELAPKYQAEDYIQHNPNVPTGRAAFVALFSQRPPVNPMPAKLDPAPVVQGAKGDYVWLMWEHEEPNPKSPGNTYHYNTLDVLRLENGKIQEHWDSILRNPPPAGSAAPAFVQPARGKVGNTGKLSGLEKKNLAIAILEMKDMLQYGHLELADKVMDPGYIQHNPNVPQARDGFKEFMGRTRKPEEIKPEWKAPPVLSLVNGNYVFMMWDRKSPDPSDPTKEYVWNHFDVLRIGGGLIKEHWDEGRFPPAPPQK
jgi:predicted SnoaL-like aldol condensation-catalyzing enzyme